MNPSLSLGQRLMADTPNFFKIAGYFGTLLIIAAAAMSYFHMAPAIVSAVGSLGAGITAVSPFAVKDVATVTGASSIAGGIVDLLPQLTDQFNQVKASIASAANTPVSLPTEILSLLGQTAANASAAAPTINAGTASAAATQSQPPTAAAASAAPAAAPVPDPVAAAIQQAKAQMVVV